MSAHRMRKIPLLVKLFIDWVDRTRTVSEIPSLEKRTKKGTNNSAARRPPRSVGRKGGHLETLVSSSSASTHESTATAAAHLPCLAIRSFLPCDDNQSGASEDGSRRTPSTSSVGDDSPHDRPALKIAARVSGVDQRRMLLVFGGGCSQPSSVRIL